MQWESTSIDSSYYSMPILVDSWWIPMDCGRLKVTEPKSSKRTKAWVTADLFHYCFTNSAEGLTSIKKLVFQSLTDDWQRPLDTIQLNIQVVLLPANTTSILQPICCIIGVTAAFKAYYVYRTLQLLLKSMNDVLDLTVSSMWKTYQITDTRGISCNRLSGCWINLSKVVNRGWVGGTEHLKTW